MHSLARCMILLSACVIIKICKKHPVLNTTSNIYTLTLAHLRCFHSYLDPREGGVKWTPLPHLSPERQLQLKWNFDSGYICIWGSPKIVFVHRAFVLFTLLPRKQEVLFTDFVTLFLKFIIKSLIYSKLVFFFPTQDCLSLAHSKSVNFIGRECPNFEGDG